MPLYRVVFTYNDSLGGTTLKEFEGTFADFPTAATAAVALKSDLVAVTKAAINKQVLSQVDFITATPTAGSTVFEKVSATVELTGGGKFANLELPSPVDAIMGGNSLNPNAALWTALTANFAAGEWAVSDGEHIIATKSGKRVFRNSGKTNLS